MPNPAQQRRAGLTSSPHCRTEHDHRSDIAVQDIAAPRSVADEHQAPSTGPPPGGQWRVDNAEDSRRPVNDFLHSQLSCGDLRQRADEVADAHEAFSGDLPGAA